MKVISEGWNVPFMGTPMFQVLEKIKHIKTGLKRIHSRDFAKLEDRIEHIKGE